jgi:hypothetical protein
VHFEQVIISLLAFTREPLELQPRTQLAYPLFLYLLSLVGVFLVAMLATELVTELVVMLIAELIAEHLLKELDLIQEERQEEAQEVIDLLLELLEILSMLKELIH